MLAPVLAIGRRDFWYLVRHPVTLLWAFVMPIVFFSFIGRVTMGFRGDPAARERIGILWPDAPGFLGEALERHLGRTGLEAHRVRDAAALAAYSRRLQAPPGFTASVLAGRRVELQFQSTAGGQGAEYEKIRINRAVYGLLAEIIAAGRQAGALSEQKLAGIAAAPRQLQIEAASAGKRRDPPTGYQQSVPGSLVMFVLFVMLTGGSAALVAERQSGILRRLAASPLSRLTVVQAKYSSRLALGLVQAAVGALAGTALFRIEWGQAPWAAALILIAYVALCAALSLWLSALARTPAQAATLGVLAANLFSAVGGCWWPAEVMPAWMRQISLATPTGLTMDALHRLMSFGDGLAAVLPHLAILALTAAALTWLGARSFRFQ